MAVGPLARLIAQVIVPVVAVLARALPAAYAQALQNAKKAGMDANNPSVKNMLRKTMEKSEALQILNLSEAEATAEAIQKQYEKYFQANDVKNGGSFYIQSKIYRAKELLDQYEAEKKQQQAESTSQKQQGFENSNNYGDNEQQSHSNDETKKTSR